MRKSERNEQEKKCERREQENKRKIRESSRENEAEGGSEEQRAPTRKRESARVRARASECVSARETLVLVVVFIAYKDVL